MARLLLENKAPSGHPLSFIALVSISRVEFPKTFGFSLRGRSYFLIREISTFRGVNLSVREAYEHDICPHYTFFFLATEFSSQL